MFVVVIFIFLGIIIGHLLHRHAHVSPSFGSRWLPRTTTFLIWLLLFLLGAAVGSNERVMASLPVLGLEAVVLSVMAVLGSSLLSWLLWLSVRRREREADPHQRGKRGEQ